MFRRPLRMAHQPYIVTATEAARWSQATREARSLVLAARPHAVLWRGFTVSQHGEQKTIRFAVVDGKQHLSAFNAWAETPATAWRRAAMCVFAEVPPTSGNERGPARAR